MLEFINKQIGEPITKLNSVSDVENFIALRSARKYSLSTVHVVITAVLFNVFDIPVVSILFYFKIGFFSEHEDIEEDDYEDFIETGKSLQVIVVLILPTALCASLCGLLQKKEDIYFGVVTDAKVSKHFMQRKMIDRTPSIYLVNSFIIVFIIF